MTVILATVMALIIPGQSFGETAAYDGGYQAPICTSGVSPCDVPAALIQSRDNIAGGSEPNQPNTLAASPCSDGILGEYQNTESLESFTVIDPTPPYFQPGDLVDIRAWVYCDPVEFFNDFLLVYVADSPDSPVWGITGIPIICMQPGLSQLFITGVSLPMTTGNVAIRLQFQRLPDPNPCVIKDYVDYDDLVLYVSPDSDNDGLQDVLENTMCTDPDLADSDGDGLCDGNLAVGSTCSAGEDVDADGVIDPTETDPCDPDTDGDGLTDGEEVNTYGTDPLDPDTDADGLNDFAEVNFTPTEFICMAGDSCASVSGCTMQYSSTTGHNYLFCTDNKDWQGARDFCRSFGGDLVYVGDSGENEWVKVQLELVNVSSWLGYLQDPAGAEPGGGWYWSHGNPYGVEDWGPGEPNNSGGNEDCADFHVGYGFQWNDADCNTLYDFVCEDGFILNPFDPDTDGDGMNDGYEYDYSICAGLDPQVAGNTLGDNDLDGLANLGENNFGTDPCDPDTDGDGLFDGTENSYCTDPLDPDTDNDGLCDGDTAVIDGSTVCAAGEDMDLNGNVDMGETDPCNANTDGDSLDDGADCGPLDPNNWISCLTCLDGDTDNSFLGCDAYVTITGPDCDDGNPNVWDACATCADGDGDTYYDQCNDYVTINGPDCDDGNTHIYPDAPELCDGIDNQCPGDAGYGEIDETCPTINVSLFDPATATDVNKDQFFDFTVDVTCGLTADCGDVTVALDPIMTLTTTNAGGNSHDGNMFNLSATTRPVTIKKFSINFNAGAVNAWVYWHPDGYVASDDGQWNLVGTAPITGVPGTFVDIPLDVDIVIQPGQTVGFYITNSGGTEPDAISTNGDISAYSNADLNLADGIGLGFPFAGPGVSNRIWNGAITYETKSLLCMGNQCSQIQSLVESDGWTYSTGASCTAGHDVYLITQGTADAVYNNCVAGGYDLLVDAYWARFSAAFQATYGPFSYAMGRQVSTVSATAHEITAGYSGDITFSTNGGRIVYFADFIANGGDNELMYFAAAGQTSLGTDMHSGGGKLVLGGTFFIYQDDFPDWSSAEGQQIFLNALDWLYKPALLCLGTRCSLVQSLVESNDWSFSTGAGCSPGYDAVLITEGLSDAEYNNCVAGGYDILVDGYWARDSAAFQATYGPSNYSMGRQVSTVSATPHEITAGYSGDVTFSTNGGRITFFPDFMANGGDNELMYYSTTGQISLGTDIHSGGGKLVLGGTFFIFTSDFPDYSSVEGQQIFINALNWLIKKVVTKGLIPTDSGTPFYTTDPNPVTINLLAGQSQQVTWSVNATGDPATYIFFATAEVVAEPSIGSTTDTVAITIVPCDDGDGDGISDHFDNCQTDANPGQEDAGWKTQAGASVVLDDDMDIYTWWPGLEAQEVSSPVHDGNIAFLTNDNDHFANDYIGTVGDVDYIRFWLYLTAADADLLLQVRCIAGGWEHRWGFSSNGFWEGLSWPRKGEDYNLPLAQWFPVLLHLEDDLGCVAGDSIIGLAFSVQAGDTAYFDSVALYADFPEGDACDFTGDFDADGVTDGAEYNYTPNDFTCMAGDSCASVPGCSMTYSDTTGHNYLFCTDTNSWQDARDKCRSYGGDLAVIDDGDENDWVINRLSTHTWIGLNDLDSEDIFVYSHGSPVSFTYWLEPGQPNPANDTEDCVRYYNFPPYSWADSGCTMLMNYVCEDGLQRRLGRGRPQRRRGGVHLQFPSQRTRHRRRRAFRRR
jgi:hypothetical protein